MEGEYEVIKLSELPVLDGDLSTFYIFGFRSTESGRVLMSQLIGPAGKSVEMQKGTTHLQWRLVGATTWNDIIALSDIVGEKGDIGLPGKKVLIRRGTTHLQYQYEGDTVWTDLISIEDLMGSQGIPGPAVRVGTNGNYWHYDNATGEYVDSGINASASVDLQNAAVTFTEAETKVNIASGETIPNLFGKIKKWFSSFGALAWLNNIDYNGTVIQNKPTIPAEQIQSDWNQTTNTAKDFIKNKPTIPAEQIQSDWNQTTNTAKDYIKNKPTIPTVTNDFTNDYKGYIDFMTGHNAIATLVSVPVTKYTVLATLTSSVTLSLAAILASGRQLVIKCYNSSVSTITITLPTTAPFESKEAGKTTNVSSIELPAGTKCEISIMAIDGTYYIKSDV